jgi:hypothetical protein
LFCDVAGTAGLADAGAIAAGSAGAVVAAGAAGVVVVTFTTRSPRLFMKTITRSAYLLAVLRQIFHDNNTQNWMRCATRSAESTMDVPPKLGLSESN